jgi:hypothetical protein
MIFGGEHNHWQRRYSTRAKAEIGHAAAVGLVATEELVKKAEERQ